MEIDVQDQAPCYADANSSSGSTSRPNSRSAPGLAAVTEATRLADLANPAAALKREIARKKAEIVSGFPLAGLLSRATGKCCTGTTVPDERMQAALTRGRAPIPLSALGVIGHLHPLEGMPVSNFYYPAPEGDPGPRTLASDPLLRDYTREVQVLLGPASGPSTDPTVSQEDADRLRQSAVGAFQSAARRAQSNPKNMDGL